MSIHLRLALSLLLAACHAAAPSADTPRPPSSTGPANHPEPSAAMSEAELEPAEPAEAAAPRAAGLYALEAESLEGESLHLARYAGKVTLVVNVASHCGFTGQYAGLQELHEELAPHGFAVLGFPSNDFGRQEPGTPQEIRAFCTTTYGVTFPMFGKARTKVGAGQSPIYAWLGAEAGTLPSWNFGKYLVDRDGRLVRFFASDVEPQSATLRDAILAALGE